MSETPASQSTNNQEFAIVRIYTKDLSFEAPNTPTIFHEEWTPDVNLELHTTTTPIDEFHHEVVLSVTVTVKSKDKIAFLAEVKQAGIFTLKEFSSEQTGAILGSVCPGILFPYVREVVSDIVTRGSFPQLLLSPINFDALYAQHLQQQQQRAAESNKINPEETETTH